MEMMTLGKHGPQVSRFGLGCMGMSDMYGNKSTRDDSESLATIDAALDSGMNFFNTGDYYGMGHNEMLLREAMKGRREKFFVSVKFGALRGPKGEWLGKDLRPQAVRNFISYSLQRLGTDTIDLYQPGRMDPTVPIEDTVGAIAELIREGKVRYVGLSEMTADLIRRAHKVHPVCAVEVEYSLASRVVENEVLPTIRELGIGLVAYGALSRGLLSGTVTGAFPPGDFRNYLPRFSGENLKKNNILVEHFREFAEKKGATASQIAIAWVSHRGPDILTLIGTSNRKRLAENLKAAEIRLTGADMEVLERIFQENEVAGGRYPEGITDIVK